MSNPNRPRGPIVGADQMGLATAMELEQHGLACQVIERNDRVGHAQRAGTTNVRTHERPRRWGIAQKLRAASPLCADYLSNVVLVTRLVDLTAQGLLRRSAHGCAWARPAAIARVKPRSPLADLPYLPSNALPAGLNFGVP